LLIFIHIEHICSFFVAFFSATIDEIYKSEFFVVAKPAVDKPEIEKDFCLAYNIPEIKLARAMTCSHCYQYPSG
jgi:uncharacterized protein (DUF1684 family)